MNKKKTHNNDEEMEIKIQLSKKGQIGMPTKLKDKEKEIVSEIVRQINQGNINEAR